MLVAYTKIISSQVYEIKNQSKVGSVAEVVIQKTDLKVSGILLKKNQFLPFSPKLAISSADFVDISSGTVIINNEDSITHLDEMVRLKESVKEGFLGIHQIVSTKSGKKIGVVTDFVIDSTTNSIIKFYVKTLFSEKIIGANSVVELEGKKLIIKDDFEKIKIKSAAIETSVI